MEDKNLQDLVKTVRDLTEKISPQGQIDKVNGEVSSVFKRTTTLQTSTSGSSASGSTSNLRRLMNMRKIGTNVTRKSRTQNNSPFMCDLILLAGPQMKIVPKQSAKLGLMEKGHILSACQFHKGMSETQVEATIIEAFGDKVPSDVSIEILVSAHNKLVKPAIAPGPSDQGINGLILHRLFKSKPVYVLPSKQLIILKTDCDNKHFIEPMEDEDEASNKASSHSFSSSSSSSARVVCESAVVLFLMERVAYAVFKM